MKNVTYEFCCVSFVTYKFVIRNFEIINFVTEPFNQFEQQFFQRK
jgi:hypothetical protein